MEGLCIRLGRVVDGISKVDEFHSRMRIDDKVLELDVVVTYFGLVAERKGRGHLGEQHPSSRLLEASVFLDVAVQVSLIHMIHKDENVIVLFGYLQCLHDVLVIQFVHDIDLSICFILDLLS